MRDKLHCMIDLETVGNTHDAAIVEIGWCLFTVDEIKMSFSRRVYLEDALKHGVITASTIMWWINQPQAARDHVFGAIQFDILLHALNALKDSIQSWKPEHFWAHASFDFPILANAFKSLGMENPVNFRKCRDLRTLDMLAHAETIDNWPVRQGVHHTAIDDAVHQARCVQLMLKNINWKEVN